VQRDPRGTTWIFAWELGRDGERRTKTFREKKAESTGVRSRIVKASRGKVSRGKSKIFKKTARARSFTIPTEEERRKPERAESASERKGKTTG